jgi:imidazolonepropionase-like amidohydrolase
VAVGGGSRTLLVQGAVAWLGPGRVVDDPAVALRGSRVVYAGPASGAPHTDEELAGDWFLMPGVVDHHVHIRMSEPRAVLAGGVTAVRDLGWAPEDVFPVADISQATDFDGPAIAAVGPFITAVGGYPSRAGWCPPAGWIEVRGTDEAAAAVERVAALDPAAIKVALNAEAGPTLADAELVAVSDAAHARKLSVVAHVQGSGQTERALGGGVDELGHTPWTERLSDELVSAVARRMIICSTLDIQSYGQRTPQLDVALDNLRRLVQAGGRVRYGTDLGNGPIPPGIHLREVLHLAAAGLSAESVLTAMAGWRLRDGAPGDLLALAGNPLEDLGAFGEVRLVIRSGRVRRPTP